MSLEYQQLSKYTTRVVGTKEQIEDLRKKLRDLGIMINDSLYIELMVVPQEINDLKKKYNIEKTQRGIIIHVPSESKAQIDEIFGANNEIQLQFPKNSGIYNFTRNGETISVLPPIDYQLTESILITNSLKLLKLPESEHF